MFVEFAARGKYAVRDIDKDLRFLRFNVKIAA